MAEETLEEKEDEIDAEKLETHTIPNSVPVGPVETPEEETGEENIEQPGAIENDLNK